MAEVKPFRAVRYADDVELARVVAPPYDVISPEQRREYLARDPHNVVHLTLPESEADAARDFRAWQEDGTLVREAEPALWWVSQDYVGPDGVARTREGFAGSVRVEPYAARVVLPHERTHAGPKEGRLRLLRAARAQLEPIFVLYDGPAPPGPEGPPDLEASEGGVTSRLWRISEPAAIEALTAPLRDRQLLIADGHHRYETAVAFHEEEPSATHTFAVLVSSRDPGLEIFPTHRVFAEAPPERLDGVEYDSPEQALEALRRAPADSSSLVVYRAGRAVLHEGEPGQLDVELVDRLGHEGISYTPDWRDAVARVDAGEAQVAALMRPTPLRVVQEVAAGGGVMPQKSTYFYPKLLSGLLFHPV